MIPGAMAAQLQQGLADFLRVSFWSSTPGMEQVVEDLIAEPGGLGKGPYLSVKLPFLAGTQPDYFAQVPLPFTPHAHQEQAFAPLGGRRKHGTLVATGTGSGKTECFIQPILDHCLAEHDVPGVKAILVYPMNALGTDQAERLARAIHGNDRLRGRGTAGLYIGGQGRKSRGHVRMGKEHIITDRSAMRASPQRRVLWSPAGVAGCQADQVRGEGRGLHRRPRRGLQGKKGVAREAGSRGSRAPDARGETA